MLPNFVAKVTIDRRSCLQLNGRLVIEEFAALRSGLIAAANRDAAALFAEPVLTAKGERLEIAWYAEQAGEPKPLDGLDPEIRRIVAAKLKNRLDSLAPLLASDLGPLLTRALYVAGSADVLAIGQEPLLIRWGMLPDALSPLDQPALERHFAETLGPYVGFGAPAIAPSRPMATRPTLVAATDTPALQPPEPENRSLPVMIPSQNRMLLAAVAAAALCALLLAVPSVISALAPAVDTAALARAKDATTALRDKVEQARAALAAANCQPDPGGTPPAQGETPPNGTQPDPSR